MKINKITLLIFLGIFLLVSVIATDSLITKSIDLTSQEKEILVDLGIGKVPITNTICKIYDKPSEKDLDSVGECLEYEEVVSGYSDDPVISPCINKDNFTCVSRIYQKAGINKEIEINYKYCIQYGINETAGDCLNYKTLSEEEIETQLQNKTQNLFKGIVQIQEQRNIRLQEEMTNQIKINS